MEEQKRESVSSVPKDQVQIYFKDCSFSWGFRVKEVQSSNVARGYVETQNETQPILSGINLDLKQKGLVTVVGQVGEGKTTLLYSIMEEAQKVKGESKIQGSIAYVEQEPFIYPGTIKENITMGLVFDENRFSEAIKVSQLVHDMHLFDNGTETVIGERGVNISGGQRARISLARAIYSDADIYLLDDPISAVDPKVANDIFEECILKCLKDKLVILVTHQL